MACEFILRDLNVVALTRPISAHVDLPATTAAVPAARRFIYDALRGTPAERVLDDALLLTSELVTNVIRHVRSDVHLGLSRDDANVLVTVQDHNPAGPAERARNAGPDLFLESGRGLGIIESLADDFGWTRLPDDRGKVSWFVLAIPAASPEQLPSALEIPRQESGPGPG